MVYPIDLESELYIEYRVHARGSSWPGLPQLKILLHRRSIPVPCHGYGSTRNHLEPSIDGFRFGDWSLCWPITSKAFGRIATWYRIADVKSLDAQHCRCLYADDEWPSHCIHPLWNLFCLPCCGHYLEKQPWMEIDNPKMIHLHSPSTSKSLSCSNSTSQMITPLVV